MINELRQAVDCILIGYGGSHAYGTSTPSSDIDIRGIYMNPPDELIGIKKDSEQFIAEDGDVVIYSIKKVFRKHI